MTTYRKYIIIDDPNYVILSGLPFQPGQRVEIVLTVDDEQTPAHVQELQTLFKLTQQLPQAKAISDEEIHAEIAAYRSRE